MEAELPYGAAGKSSARLIAQLESVFGMLEILPFETPAKIIYGDLRTQPEAAGKLIGRNKNGHSDLGKVLNVIDNSVKRL